MCSRVLTPCAKVSSGIAGSLRDVLEYFANQRSGHGEVGSVVELLGRYRLGPCLGIPPAPHLNHGMTGNDGTYQHICSRRVGEAHVLILLEPSIICTHGSGDGFDVKEEGLVDERERCYRQLLRHG